MNSGEATQLAGAIPSADLCNSLGGIVTVLAADAAIPIDRDGVYLLNKASAGAFSVAAPGTNNAGRKITFLTGTDFAHVVTFTGTTLRDGTAGLNTTWTATAVAGCSLTVQAISATLWNVVSFNLGTIAP